eukprot:snap_masked-scaffold_43-processed-gene-1.82-mRNA-1 protein AED:1.00 eAED:1.00 QI:0/-1/0/0/-1/1/1/0/66
MSGNDTGQEDLTHTQVGEASRKVFKTDSAEYKRLLSIFGTPQTDNDLFLFLNWRVLLNLEKQINVQ